MDTITPQQENQPEAPDEPLKAGRPFWLMPWVAYLVIGLISFAGFRAHNDFPNFFHPDEHRKVRYVVQGENRFYHPMLLTGTARLVHYLTGSCEKADVYKLGRTVSAGFAALAVILLMAMAHRLRGISAAWAVGALCGTSYSLLLLAHYFKEDTALLFGLAATFHAMARLRQHVTAGNALWLGAGCALAASGKYAGALVLPFALFAMALSMHRRFTWGRLGAQLAGFIGGMLAVGIVINHEIVLNIPGFIAGLRFEVDHVTRGHYGLTRGGWGRFTLPALYHEVALPVLCLAALYPVLIFTRRKAHSWLDGCILVFPIAWFVVVSFSEVQLSRYLLPTVVWLHVWAGLAATEGIALLAKRGRKAQLCAALLICGAVAFNLQRSLDYLDRIEHDSRTAFATWTRNHLPPQARVLEDNYVKLDSFKGGEKRKYRFKIESPRWACLAGSLDAVRAQGFTHVAITDIAYDRFYNPGYAPIDATEAAKIETYRQFYDQLRAEGRLVWSYEPDFNMRAFTDPAISFYQIAEMPGAQAPSDEGR